MFRYQFVTLGFAAASLIAAVTAQQPIKVPVSTRYITTSVTTIGSGQSKTFIASLCNQFQGDTVNATVLLNNNPGWDPATGVIYFYIVDNADKTQKDALCNNTNAGGITGPSCVIPKWSSPNNLFLKARAGDVAAISFSVDIDIKKPMGASKFSKPEKQYGASGYVKSFNATVDSEYLTEVVTVETNQELVLKGQALLDVTFCPNPSTTDDYSIYSTVFGTDGISSYTQYICDKLPCTVDSPNIVGYNGKQLPNNEVVLSTQSAEYSHIYVLIIEWAGQFEPAKGTYVGRFQFNAALLRNS